MAKRHFYLKIPCLWYWSFVGTEFGFCPDEILHCCRLSVPECLSIRFLRPVSRTRMQVGLVCFLRLFPVCSGRIRHFSEIFFIFFRVCFGGVKSMFYSILLGGFGGISYLCKDSPLKIFLENIWWERKKYLPLQPQTRNKRPSR